MKKFLFINYYSDKNSERKKELIYCFQKNLELEFIDKIYTFIEKKEELDDLYKLKNKSKIFPIITNKKRITKKDILDYAKKIKKKFILIAITADIYLANSKNWRNIDKEFFNKSKKNKVIFCSRNSIKKEKLSKRQIKFERKSTLKGEYLDAFVFKKPFLESFLRENLNFVWGSAGGDGLLMGIASKYYDTYYWGDKYKIFHYDVVRKKNESPLFTFNSIEITENIEIGSMLRPYEMVRIPKKQNWVKLLKKGKKPKVIFLKKQDNFIIKNLKIIYYFINLTIKKYLIKFF